MGWRKVLCPCFLLLIPDLGRQSKTWIFNIPPHPILLPWRETEGIKAEEIKGEETREEAKVPKPLPVEVAQDSWVFWAAFLFLGKTIGIEHFS